MKISPRHCSIAASIALLIYLVALWSEAAYHAGGIGFTEDLTWSRILAAYRVTNLDHVMRLEILPMGVVAVIGMLAAIMADFMPNRTFPTWGLFLYVTVLLISGGWLGLLIIPFVPFENLDGEFLDDSFARVTACGVWTTLVLTFLGHRIVKVKRITEQQARQVSSESDPSGEPSP